MLHAEQRADDIHVDHAAQTDDVDVGNQRRNLDTRIVDQDIKAADLLDHGGHCFLPLRFIGDIEMHEAGLGAFRGQTRGGFATEIIQDIADDHGRAGLCQRRCDGGAYGAGAAGHESMAARQAELVSHSDSLPILCCARTEAWRAL